MKNIPIDDTLNNLHGLIEIWRKTVDVLKAQSDLKNLCIALDVLDQQYSALDALRAELSKILIALDKEIVPAAFEAAGIDKINIPEVRKSFSPSPKYSASFVEDRDKEALQWLRDNGLGAIITETVHRGTLAATLKARLLEEGLDPPESMKLTKYTTTSITKYVPKGAK